MLPKRLERRALEFEVRIGISASRGNAGMAEIVADDREVDPGLKERASATVPKHMR